MKVNLSVSDVMSTSVLKALPGDSVMSILLKMKDKNIGSAIAVESDKVVGIITERDIAFKVAAEKRDAETTPISEVMHSPVTTIYASMDVTEAADLMRKNGFRRLPVVDSEGKLMGIVTEKDIADVEPDLVRLLQDLLEARDEKNMKDSISKYHNEKLAREEFDKIKSRRKL